MVQESFIGVKKKFQACFEEVSGKSQFVNVQSLLHENVVFSACARMGMGMGMGMGMRAWAMPRILYLSCGVPFPVWTPDNISGLISVVPKLSR